MTNKIHKDNPIVGEWCNINNSAYEIIEISEAGVVKIETISYGELHERKLVLKTLIEQIDEKGFYLPTNKQSNKREEEKRIIKSEVEMREEPKKELNASQKLFCRYYLEPEHYGNGIQAYMKAYPNCSYESAKTQASRLLRNVHVCSHLATMLDSIGLNDANVDRQTLYIINQMDDLPSKNRAIAEYNKVRGRITEKINLSGSVGNSDLKNMTTAELLERKKQMEKDAKELEE